MWYEVYSLAPVGSRYREIFILPAVPPRPRAQVLHAVGYRILSAKVRLSYEIKKKVGNTKTFHSVSRNGMLENSAFIISKIQLSQYHEAYT